MSAPFERITGQRYTRPVAFLLASIIGPVGLIATRPNGPVAVAITCAISVMCFGVAWVCWSKYSDRTVPSLDLSPRRR